MIIVYRLYHKYQYFLFIVDGFENYVIELLNNNLSHDVASGSDITPCKKLDN